MKLDLRKPTLIFLGHWNRAIFQPGWIALNLFQIPEGKEVRAEQVIQIGPNPEPLLFIQGLGFSTTRERVSLHLNDMSEATKDRAEQVALRLFEILPHTPFGPFGVNFEFVEDDPSDKLLDALKTNDGIDQHYKIASQNLKVTIVLEEQVSLNFSRQPSDKSVIFNFNYHH